MFVSKSMTHKVVTIGKDAGILQARELLNQHKIRHLPVVDENRRLIGIVTDRDVRSAMPSVMLDDFHSREERQRLAHLTVEAVMTPNPLTVRPDHTLQDVLLLIQEAKVGALPVVDDQGVLKGIIGVRDLLDAFTHVMGIGQPGTLLGILVEEKVGQLKRIVDAITEENISFGSVLVARHWESDKRAVFPYLLTVNVSRIKRKLTEMGFTLIDPMQWYLEHFPHDE